MNRHLPPRVGGGPPVLSKTPGSYTVYAAGTLSCGGTFTDPNDQILTTTGPTTVLCSPVTGRA